MRTVFIDKEFKCHTVNDGTLQAVETDAFDGKCAEFIEGHRLKPAGATWVREDGTVFSGGEMTTPFKPYQELVIAQAQYEIQIREKALAIMGVTADD